MSQYDHLKNKLHHYKVDIDKDKLWERTFHAIPQRKRRRAVLLMLFAGLVASAWLLHSVSFSPLSESRFAFNADQNKNPDQLAYYLQDNPTGNPDDVKASQNNAIEVLSSKLSTSVTKLISGNNFSGQDHISKHKTESENTLIDTKEQNEKFQTIALPTAGIENSHSIQLKSEIEKEIIDKRNVQASEPVITEQKVGSISNIHQTEMDLNNTNSFTEIPVDCLIKDVSPISLTTKSLSTPVIQANIQPMREKFLRSFQMAQGVGFTEMKIHSLKPETAQLASQLEQKMRSLEIMSTSATATVRLPIKFSLETGVQYTRLSTVIDHEWETAERVQQEGVSTIIIDENGIPQSITGNTDVTRITNYHAKRFSEHQNIDIVFALHKEIWNAQRLALNAFVKGAYSLSYQAKGTILTYNDELIGFSKDDNPFRRISPLTIGGGLQLNYHLHPHWNLTGSVTFDQQGYQYKDPTVPVRFQHSAFSSGIGIGFMF